LLAADIDVPRRPGRDRAGIRDDDRVIAQPLAELVRDDLRLHRHVLPRTALVHQLLPLGLALLSLLKPGTISVAIEMRNQAAQDAQRVADKPDFDRVPEADAQRIDFDLHAARLARFRIELDVRKAAADDQQGVAAFERVLRRPRAEEADTARRVGAVVRHAGLAEDRLDDRRAEDLGDLFQLLAGADRAASGDDDRLLALVQQFGRLADRRIGRDMRALGPD